MSTTATQPALVLLPSWKSSLGGGILQGSGSLRTLGNTFLSTPSLTGPYRSLRHLAPTGLLQAHLVLPTLSFQTESDSPWQVNHSPLISAVHGGAALTVSGHLGAFQYRLLRARTPQSHPFHTMNLISSQQSRELTQKVH